MVGTVVPLFGGGSPGVPKYPPYLFYGENLSSKIVLYFDFLFVFHMKK